MALEAKSGDHQCHRDSSSDYERYLYQSSCLVTKKTKRPTSWWRGKSRPLPKSLGFLWGPNIPQQVYLMAVEMFLSGPQWCTNRHSPQKKHVSEPHRYTADMFHHYHEHHQCTSIPKYTIIRNRTKCVLICRLKHPLKNATICFFLGNTCWKIQCKTFGKLLTRQID